MDRGAWLVIVHGGHKELYTTERLSLSLCHPALYADSMSSSHSGSPEMNLLLFSHSHV